MNDSIYEEYMRSVLGYRPINNYNTYDNINFNNLQREELESCYPDIYCIVYPMIQKACAQNTRSITKELIDSMTDEIYSAIEDREMVENRSKDDKSSKIVEDRKSIARNNGLNDLIRILLLRELLGRPGFPSSRPIRPAPPRPPMRPPFGPGVRPNMGAFNRNIYGQFDELYEY